ncbi:MAG: RNA polymerase sigma factor [Bryobacter sp.]|nr:RNA polymerase sigma factor [Bryobacter sp.]
MRRYQGGDPSALDPLYRDISPRLKTIFRQSGQASDLDELVQETWFQIHRSRHTWRPTEALLPWIYSIARHVRANYYRRTSRRGEVELSERLSVPPTELSYDWEQLLNELPESQKEVLILMKVEGRSIEEVAAATGTTVGSVKQKAHRAYAKLRAILGGNP